MTKKDIVLRITDMTGIKQVDVKRVVQKTFDVIVDSLVRTEKVLEAGVFDLTNSQSPEFIGRVIAALAADPKLMERSGQVVVAAEAALELGVTDS